MSADGSSGVATHADHLAETCPDIADEGFHLELFQMWRRAVQAAWEQLAQPPLLRISYINGINNTKHDVERASRSISNAFGGLDVHPFWNPTGGAYSDVLKTASMKLINFPWPGEEPPEVAGLVRHLRECLDGLQDQRSKGGRILHLAHSQGALITVLASKHLTAAEKACIEVLTFGAAQSVDASAGFKRAVNYYAMNDPVLYVDVAAARAWSFQDKATVDAAMARGGASMAAEEVVELESLLQAAVKARRWHACVQIQAALDIARGQLRIQMPASTDDEADAHGSRRFEEKERGRGATGEAGLEAAGHVTAASSASRLRRRSEAELVFCRPVRFPQHQRPFVRLLVALPTGPPVCMPACGAHMLILFLTSATHLLHLNRQLSSSAMDAHKLLAPTYWREIAREAQRIQSEELERSLMGRVRLRLLGPPAVPPPPIP